MPKHFIVRFRVPLLILALLISLGGNVMLGLRLYRSAAARSAAADYHAGALHDLWQLGLYNIGGAVDARDRDDDIKAYREHMRMVQQALYGSGLSAEAVSQARGDGAFSELATVLDRYAQLTGFLSVAESGITAEDTARLESIRHDVEILVAAYPAAFMAEAGAQEIADRDRQVCRDVEQTDLAKPLCE
ncbi:MAG TPA: hypothetical protein VD886_16715 [Herpetosiphonaceae bacterium]|nr:hypothetical protein [Herpetosiphonaceae bacterium]